MLKIGVTGGIGSGKTLICRVFSTLGVPVYNADDRARSIMNEDLRVIRNLAESFGEDILRDGKPDRKALASIVFNDAGALKLINEIVHPAVQDDFITWVKKHNGSPYVIKEAAILFETGMYKELDNVILVTAPVDLRVQRVVERDNDKEENIRKRIENQWPDDKKTAMAAIVLENDNTSPVLPVILRIHSQFSRGRQEKYDNIN